MQTEEIYKAWLPSVDNSLKIRVLFKDLIACILYFELRKSWTIKICRTKSLTFQ